MFLVGYVQMIYLVPCMLLLIFYSYVNRIGINVRDVVTEPLGQWWWSSTFFVKRSFLVRAKKNLPLDLDFYAKTNHTIESEEKITQKIREPSRPLELAVCLWYPVATVTMTAVEQADMGNWLLTICVSLL